jgi:hypothetical protein
MTDKRWTVMRWSGRDSKVFSGSEDKARAKYAKLYQAMRQGAVELIDGEGKTMDRAWVPRLRTRW